MGHIVSEVVSKLFSYKDVFVEYDYTHIQMLHNQGLDLWFVILLFKLVRKVNKKCEKQSQPF